MANIHQQLQGFLQDARSNMVIPGMKDRHLLVPEQEAVSANMLDLFNDINLPLSLWASHPSSKQFFDGTNVKIGKRAGDGSWKAQPMVTPIGEVYLVLGDGSSKKNLCSGDDHLINLGDLLDAQVGAREGLTLRKHTQMVMIGIMQRLNFFIGNSGNLKHIQEFMIIAMMFHDIGKSLGHALGDKNWQHELSLPIVDYLGESFG
ncbi:hypothetical protein IWW36_001394, partial [Coemansia brasiliensis]